MLEDNKLSLEEQPINCENEEKVLRSKDLRQLTRMNDVDSGCDVDDTLSSRSTSWSSVNPSNERSNSENCTIIYNILKNKLSNLVTNEKNEKNEKKNLVTSGECDDSNQKDKSPSKTNGNTFNKLIEVLTRQVMSEEKLSNEQLKEKLMNVTSSNGDDVMMNERTNKLYENYVYLPHLLKTKENNGEKIDEKVVDGREDEMENSEETIRFDGEYSDEVKIPIVDKKEEEKKVKIEPYQRSSSLSSRAQVPHNSTFFCQICNDEASGYHYGVYSCEGCKGFFRRCITQGINHECSHKHQCPITPSTRNSCQSCRWKKCIEVGMSKKASRLGRRPKTTKDGPPIKKMLRDDEKSSFDINDDGTEKYRSHSFQFPQTQQFQQSQQFKDKLLVNANWSNGQMLLSPSIPFVSSSSSSLMGIMTSNQLKSIPQENLTIQIENISPYQSVPSTISSVTTTSTVNNENMMEMKEERHVKSMELHNSNTVPSQFTFNNSNKIWSKYLLTDLIPNDTFKSVGIKRMMEIKEKIDAKNTSPISHQLLQLANLGYNSLNDRCLKQLEYLRLQMMQAYVDHSPISYSSIGAALTGRSTYFINSENELTPNYVETFATNFIQLKEQSFRSASILLRTCIPQFSRLSCEEKLMIFNEAGRSLLSLNCLALVDINRDMFLNFNYNSFIQMNLLNNFPYSNFLSLIYSLYNEVNDMHLSDGDLAIIFIYSVFDYGNETLKNSRLYHLINSQMLQLLHYHFRMTKPLDPDFLWKILHFLKYFRVTCNLIETPKKCDEIRMNEEQT
ncbi:hypothetical protein SNEBB_001757 [Seison nebaliae]|nr:hypothetical protein SNEBB_001757 [Seison nebaliae]